MRTWVKVLITDLDLEVNLWCKEVDDVINRMKSYREISRLQENKNGREKEAELYCFYQNLLWSRVKVSNKNNDSVKSVSPQ